MIRRINDFQLTKNFNLREFMSHDTNEVMIYPEVVEKLPALRDIIGVQIRVNSGYRAPERNKAVGGVLHSYHMFGKAVDITVFGVSPDILKQIALKVGFSFVKYYPDRNYFHLDIGVHPH